MKKTLGLIFLSALFISAVSFFAPPLLLQSRPTEKIIIEEIEKMTGARLTARESDLSYFPFLTIRFNDVQLVSEGRTQFAVEAKELEIRLARFPLLLGRTQIASLSLNGMRWKISEMLESGDEALELHDAVLRTGPLKANQPIKINLTGSVNKLPGVLSARTSVTFKSLKRIEWLDTTLDAVLNVGDVPLSMLKESIRKHSGMDLISGTWTGQWTFRKDPEAETLRARAEGKIKNFSYRLSDAAEAISSPTFDVGFQYQLNWNPVAEVFNVQSASLSAPFGKLEVNGNLFGSSKGVQDIRVTATDVVLESIPQYFVGLKNAIPFNIGFSGLSRMEMSISGTWDKLMVNAKLDLTQALLTYARYFSKPREMPLDVVFDYQLVDKSILSGDFSLRFRDMTMKGSLTDLSLDTGEGQLNVITNKFQLKDWELFIPLFQGYKVEGGIKLFANFKGNLQKLYETKSMFNFTLEQGYLAGASGKELKDIHMTLDLSPMELDVRELRFKVGDASDVSGSLKVYNLVLNPVTRLSLQSEQLDAALLTGTLKDLAEPWIPEPAKPFTEEWTDRLSYFSPAGELWKNVSLEMTYENGRWHVPDMHFDAYLGTVQGNGEWVYQGKAPGSSWSLKVERLNLSRYSRRGGKETGLMEGNLFLNANLRAPFVENLSWKDTLEGAGVFLVTNGEFSTFNLLGAVAEIPDFLDIFKQPATGTTPFHDLQAEFKIGGRKLAAEKMILLSDRLQAEAAGDWSFDGILNYRVNVFLTPESLLKESVEIDETKLQEEGLLGPVALLLSGPFEKPELKPDPSLIPRIFQELLVAKRSRALSNFLSEDFFKAPANS